LFFAVSAMIGVAVAYVVGMSAVGATQSKHAHVTDLLVSRGIEIFIVTWCLWVGTSIGSFLNVVAWRMPLGLGINGRSMCPRCRVQLRARDNFPVLGWLALGGRCRTCRLPISPRYPIVESLVGLSITVVAVGELFQLILPAHDNGWRRELSGRLSVEPSVLAIMIYHIVAIAISWAMGLIRMDGNRLPSKLVRFSAITLILPMLVYPKLMVVPWQVSVADAWQPDGRYLDSVVRVFTALGSAIFLARSMARSLCPTADPKIDPLGEGTARLVDLIAILTVPILIVGWQASVAVALIASIIAIVARRALPSVDGLGRFAISMPFAMTMQMMLWKWSNSFAYWPSEGTAPGVFLAWGAAALVIPIWLRERPSNEPSLP
jgi:leader peptidase (prepilin peptidase)/N-methyltransferase